MVTDSLFADYPHIKRSRALAPGSLKAHRVVTVALIRNYYG
jgi:hypothetical protein